MRTIPTPAATAFKEVRNVSNDVDNYEMETDRVQHIPISDLKPFEGHPFKVVDDEAMLRTTESIAQFGVLTPLLVRPMDDGSLQIISGHRRVHAAEAAGLSEVPVIVKNMTDDEAVVLMVDSNLQRENKVRNKARILRKE